VPQCSNCAWLYGLQQNAESRSNLALVNTLDPNSDPETGKSTFSIEVFDGETGLKVQTLEGITLGPGRWTQTNSILAAFAPAIKQGYARVTRTTGSNPFVAYAVINDGGNPGERTGDGAFIASSP
jgi:hypothetical protein